MSAALHLYFIRLTGLLAQGSLLIAGTVLFAFGMLELFNVLAFIALVLTWLVLAPAAARARATFEHTEYKLQTRVDASGAPLIARGAKGVTEAEYTRLRAPGVRARARRELGLRRQRYDQIQAIVTTVVWLSYFGFIGTVLAGG